MLSKESEAYSWKTLQGLAVFMCRSTNLLTLFLKLLSSLRCSFILWHDNNDEEDDLTESHNHVQEEDGRMPPDTDYLEESDEDEVVDDDQSNESNEHEVDKGT